VTTVAGANSLNGSRNIAGGLALALFMAGAAAQGDDPGRVLFTKNAAPPCALCHTLADAGTNGNIGPSLDELRPDAARVMNALKTGIGAMPAYTQLSAEQMQALASYVARVSGAK